MSGQSLMPLGFPLRTTNTMVDVYGSELLGSRFSHPGAICPALRMASVSGHRASETTSASRPSITARAWVVEPPCDCLISSVLPLCAWYFGVNAALMSRHSSRVGSRSEEHTSELQSL